MDYIEIKKSAYNFNQKFNNTDVTEESTKQFLIEPILLSLGWNINDHNLVKREYKNQVDYALFSDDFTIYIEAKKAGKELSSAMEQVLNYCLQNSERPEFIIATNGIEWICKSIKYALEIFKINLLNASDEDLNVFKLLSKDSCTNGDLKNFSNYINIENVVFNYLKQNQERFIDEIIKKDNSLLKDNVNKVFTSIISKQGKIIKVGQNSIPLGPKIASAQLSTRSTSIIKNDITKINLSGRELINLPKRYILKLNDFIKKVENRTSEVVTEIYIGKKGIEWSPEMPGPGPNFFVRLSNGNEINNREQNCGYNPTNCVMFSRNEFDTFLIDNN